MAGKRHNWTEEMDETIREMYNKYDNPLRRLETHPATCHIPRSTMIKRTKKLGVSRVPVYTPKEMEIIRSNLDKKKPVEIARILAKNGFIRTEHAVKLAIYRNGWRVQTDTYNIQDVCIAFRVSRRLVMRWVDQGRLKVRKLREDSKTAHWMIRPLNLAQFIVENSFLINGNRVDVPFICALLLEFSPQLRREQNASESGTRN